MTKARRPILAGSILAAALGIAVSCGAPELRYAEETGGTDVSDGGASGGSSGGASSGGAAGRGGAGVLPESCRNGALDGTESDEDCGGDCAACEDGRACREDADCASGACIALVCYTPGCDNGVIDDDEGGTDCGGVCDARCPAGEPCDVAADCESGVCTAYVCEEPTCTDQVKNGSESDTDCGGSNPSCARCEIGDDCRLDSDCETESCVDLRCALVCPANFDDCDGDVDNGCEANLLTSLDHCGACGQPCSLPHAVSACSAGTCVIAVDGEGLPRCTEPYAACDSDLENGCETNLFTDPNNCGACGIRCTDANGTPTCVDGACDSACNAGFADCGGDYRCETDVTSSVGNCGACGNACPAVDGTPWCRDSSCGVTPCPEGRGDCDGDGTCETDLTTSDEHCGACGNACLPQDGTGACAAGTCEIVACDDGFGDCDDEYDTGCEQSLTTLVHCAACDTPCARTNATATCETGACAFVGCNSDYGDCDDDLANGCETDLRITLGHCGACEAACAFDQAAASCVDSGCVMGSCSSGYDDCNDSVVDGCETSLSSRYDCGTCDNDCTAIHMTACTSGQCRTCATGWGDCTAAAGCETSLTKDPNCGACDNDCTGSTPRCDAGTCEASLIANGDFESNTNGWTTWSGTLGRSSARAHSGTQSLTVSGTGVGVAATSLTGLVALGQSYQFSFWVNLGGADSARMHVTSAVDCGGGATYDWLTNPVTVTAGTWVELSGTLDLSASPNPVPDGCTNLTTVTLYVEDEDAALVNPTSNVILYVDDVTLGQ